MYGLSNDTTRWREKWNCFQSVNKSFYWCWGILSMGITNPWSLRYVIDEVVCFMYEYETKRRHHFISFLPRRYVFGFYGKLCFTVRPFGRLQHELHTAFWLTSCHLTSYNLAQPQNLLFLTQNINTLSKHPKSMLIIIRYFLLS